MKENFERNSERKELKFREFFPFLYTKSSHNGTPTLSAPMKIHSIMVIKNEEDILPYCLSEALNWSDHIFIYDGLSEDETWAVALEFSKLYPDRIFPWKQDGKVFSESLRAEVFNNYREFSNPGDWWCHLDADEFYIDNPKDFIKSHSDSLHHVFWSIFVEYYPTESEILNYNSHDNLKAYLDNLSCYRANHAEPRFFKDRKNLIWENNKGRPNHVGPVSKHMLRFKHFKYRSPQQIQLRLKTRQSNRDRGFPGWEHAVLTDWKEKLGNTENLLTDPKDGNFQIEFDRFSHYRGSFQRRIFQYIMHFLGVYP